VSRQIASIVYMKAHEVRHPSSLGVRPRKLHHAGIDVTDDNPHARPWLSLLGIGLYQQFIPHLGIVTYPTLKAPALTQKAWCHTRRDHRTFNGKGS
jgi:hypothetical protein